MWRALALRMGYPLSVLKRVMSHAEFCGWCRYFEIQPFDDERCFDRPAAVVAQTVANRHRPEQEPVHELIDFMPYRRKPVLCDAELEDKVLRFL